MKRLFLVLLMLTLVLTGTGCGRHGMAIFAGGLILGSALANASHHHERERTTVVYVNNPSYYPPAPSPPPSPNERLPDDDRLPAFDPQAARSALTAVELSKCSDAGAPRAFGHAVVTINPSGDISKVVVDQPGGLPAAAVKCIGDEIGRVRVAQFRGSHITMGTTWYVP